MMFSFFPFLNESTAPRPEDLVDLYIELAEDLGTSGGGDALLESLDSFSAATMSQPLKNAIGRLPKAHQEREGGRKQTIIYLLQKGFDLAKAMKRFPDVFTNAEHLESIEIGIQRNLLPEVLTRIAENMKADIAAKREIKKELSAPAGYLVMSLGIVHGLLFYMIPMFRNQIEMLSPENIPLLVKLALWGADVGKEWGSYAIAGAFMMIVLFSSSLSTDEKNGDIWARIALRIPGLKDAFKLFLSYRWLFHASLFIGGYQNEKIFRRLQRLLVVPEWIENNRSVVVLLKGGASLENALRQSLFFPEDLLRRIEQAKGDEKKLYVAFEYITEKVKYRYELRREFVKNIFLKGVIVLTLFIIGLVATTAVMFYLAIMDGARAGIINS